MKRKKLRKILCSALLTCMISCTAVPAHYVSADSIREASGIGEVVHIQTSLIVRSNPSKSSGIKGSLKNGAKVTITGKTDGWYRIEYGSGAAYVSSDYISISGSGSSSGSSAVGSKGTVSVNTTLLVRTSPSLSGKITGYFTNGKVVDILGKENGYYKISYGSGTAYVSAAYVKTGSSSSSSSSSSFNSSNENEVLSTQKTGYADVSTSLIVRTAPSSTASIAGRYSSGAVINITGETQNWYRVSYLSRTAYVNKAYVRFNAVSSSLTSTGYDRILLNVPSYYQYDSRWANVSIGNTTLKKSGCVTTCLAMAKEYLTGSTYTPARMAGILSYTSSGSVYWPSGTTQYTGSNYLKVIYQQLQIGNPVIVGSAYAKGGYHFVLVTGYNGSSSNLTASGFKINDPSGVSSNLQNFFSKVPYFYKLVYYR